MNANLILGIDPAPKNMGFSFFNPVSNKTILCKIDISKCFKTGKTLHDIDYKISIEKIINKCYKQIMRTKIVVIERLPLKNKKIKPNEDTRIIMVLLETILTYKFKHLIVMYVQPKSVKHFMGTSSSTSYTKRKLKSREKRITSESNLKLIKRKFKKIDDVLEATHNSMFYYKNSNLLMKKHIKKQQDDNLREIDIKSLIVPLLNF